MLAAILKDYTNLVLEDVPVPSPGRGEALVRVKACGFCATDYAPRVGSAECEQAEVGKCREFPQHDCVCMVTKYGNEGRCYE